MVKTHRICLALGSNLGDRMAALRGACGALQPFVQITARAPIYETPPAYVTDQPAFLNSALVGETNLNPNELLAAVKAAEKQVGRTKTFQYGPRALDIDIIFYEQSQIATEELQIPHQHFAVRDFVLYPLADIAADWVDPISQKTVSQLLKALPTAGPPQLCSQTW